VVLSVLGNARAPSTFLGTSPSVDVSETWCGGFRFDTSGTGLSSSALLLFNSDSMSRTQYVMALGQPCVDLAFYRLSWGDDNFDPAYATSFTPINALIEAGFTYEYVSPSLFDLDTSVIEDGYVFTLCQSPSLVSAD
jgi:hypothetical protein